MDWSSIIGLLEHVKSVPQNLAVIIVFVTLFLNYFLKKRDSDVNSVSQISKLQSEQLTTLINQNKLLAEELHNVRVELSEAYTIIDDLRKRVIELEEMIRDNERIKRNDSYTRRDSDKSSG